MVTVALVTGTTAVSAQDVSLVAFAYSSEECTDGTFVPRTANGTGLRPGVMAVDPEVLPFGSILDVPGYGLAQGEDSGGAIVGNTIDLLFPSRDAAYAWGKQELQAVLLRKGWHEWQLEPLKEVLAVALDSSEVGGDPQLDRTVTRAEWAVMVARILGIAPKPTCASFRDVPYMHWAAPTLAALRDREVFVGGEDGCFRPDEPVVWSDLAAFLARYGISDPHQIYVHSDALTRGEVLLQLRPLLAKPATP